VEEFTLKSLLRTINIAMGEKSPEPPRKKIKYDDVWSSFFPIYGGGRI
jgi:hypothetical protein